MIKDYEIKELALARLQEQLQRVNGNIERVQARLGVKTLAPRKSRFSAAGIERIREAQRRRWALAKGGK